jgi:D-ribose pyranase
MLLFNYFCDNLAHITNFGASMLKTGILNPQINSLLARVRHTNMLVIADRGFPSWPMIETVDIALIDDIPTVLQVLAAIRPNFDISHVYMAEEFRTENSRKTQAQFAQTASGIPVSFEPHVEFKKRVPQAIGLIRTGDTTQYANMILVSGRV